METIAERLKSAYQTIEQSTLAANRPPNTVQLLAVSKTKPVSDIVQAYEAGQRLFGENYVQEGVEKVQALRALSDIEWHFIGPIQSNKTRLVAENFAWVHAIDRLKIAQRLNDQRSAHKQLNVCIQVNIDDEASKSGVPIEEVKALAAAINPLPHLKLRGLMTIPKADASEVQQKHSFSAMQELFVEMHRLYPEIDTLSMGMSGDIKPAIAHGSTMVRIGTAIFGSRQ
ncbi:MAG: YggS family pyridoxal phosphate-dependent enzyme [Paraglaciecola sp.]|uniref:YggS family pyridoxal phosphate-dependent enzyme n=1 Tax=Pseudomonadati TaxID=3379134 RepID=UPI00273FAC09|nr:YggS family pyridoxal phosphate-dependent enzyme [Paraglaciecola sp.]MDP5032887.1 YggS family pyridoxal phosphate-dependent enzyme [Paraglaciecola sp.]MDP5040585.1 YggS family pyridoxal phosphate-dependent enzyme [Paraglaciecola sp.]MDP5132813.1 YggS family pyridoxal phosphate-dependent enzyme [Paraglaciecola sp.]